MEESKKITQEAELQYIVILIMTNTQNKLLYILLKITNNLNFKRKPNTSLFHRT
jgi:hypothetical protein